MENNKNDEDDEIVINVGSTKQKRNFESEITNFDTTEPATQNDRKGGKRAKHEAKKEGGKHTSRIAEKKEKRGTQEKQSKDKNGKEKKPKKKWSRKKKVIVVLSVLLLIIILLGSVFGVYLFKAKGSVKDAVLNMATDIVGEQDPIFVLILGVSEDISAKLTDTIILCGYNPSTQKAFMLSVPRDTFVGKNPASANGYDKINAQFQKSAEKTVEAVEILTGVTIDHYVIVRNISIESIFDCIGSIDFDVPINMDYDDPTQDLHIHLKKGYQTLQPNQIEQLLRFRHNNNGTSYPSSYGDNDYGRMRTQREFIKAAMSQILSLQNVGKIKDLVSMVYTNLQTNISGHKVLDYVPHVLKFDTSKLRSEQLPGQSAMINSLWFYQASKSKTKALLDELMIYLELDDDILESHYRYASEIKGVKPTDDWEPEEIVIDEDYDTGVDQSTCKHDYKVYESSASCTNPGTITYKCTICGKEKDESQPALGHSYSGGVCVRCGEKDPNYQEHTHSFVQKREEPTCSEVGRIYNECSSCGAVEPGSEVTLEPTGKHNYIDVVDSQPTCENPGKKHRECSQCHQTEPGSEKELPKLGHSYVKHEEPATCEKSGTRYEECSKCHSRINEETLPAIGHKFSSNNVEFCENDCGKRNENYVKPTDDPSPGEITPTPGGGGNTGSGGPSDDEPIS